jgi:hypothetical protein
MSTRALISFSSSWGETASKTDLFVVGIHIVAQEEGQISRGLDMVRTRDIKPGFFQNEVLMYLHPLCRLLFIGLWGLADREGRLEDRPKKIKAMLLPVDRCDVDKFLDDLHSNGFVFRYEKDGRRCIQILNWKKHQKHIHPKESLSELPEF